MIDVIVNNTINSIKTLGSQQVDPTVSVNGVIANTIHLLDSVGADTSKIKSKLQEMQQQSPEE